MKRFRIVVFDFDTRSLLLDLYQGREDLTELENNNYQRLLKDLILQFGEDQAELKIRNFIDVQSKPFSIIAYHNIFLNQIRNAFIIGCYYPALIGACTLGERILNHLTINLRDHFKAHEL